MSCGAGGKFFFDETIKDKHAQQPIMVDLVLKPKQ